MLLKPLAMHDTVFANTGLSPFVNTGNILLQQTTQIRLHLSQRNTFNPQISPGKVFFKSRSGWHSLMRGKDRDSETQNFYRIRSFFLFQCFFLTQPPALLPLGEIFEAISGATLCLLMLLDVPRQLGGDVSDEEAARPQTVIVAPHSELAVLQWRHIISNFMTQMSWMFESQRSWLIFIWSFFVCKV